MQQLGRYQIIKQLGAGGFGAVYLAHDPVIKRDVAIKVFQPKDDNVIAFATSTNTEGLDVLRNRFQTEAQILAKLDDAPHIVSVLEYGTTDDGAPYYVMPYLKQSLADLLGKDVFETRALEELPAAQHPKAIAFEMAMVYLGQTLKGMADAHEQGLVHRDIKPGNIMLSDKGQIKIVDFGIAKAPDGGHSTVSNLGMGSRNYMAPEQRESAKHVDARADVYSLGVLAYRMFTGKLPTLRFADPNIACPQLPEGINQLILQALSEDLHQRPTNAGAMQTAFTQANTALPDTSEHSGTWVESGASSVVKAEFKPLQTKLKESLTQYGEVTAKTRKALNAMAKLVNMDDAALTEFITIQQAQFSEENPELGAYMAFIARINALSAQGEKLDDDDVVAMAEAGAMTTGRPVAELTDIVRSKCLAKSAIKFVKPQSKPKPSNADASNSSGSTPPSTERLKDKPKASQKEQPTEKPKVSTVSSNATAQQRTQVKTTNSTKEWLLTAAVIVAVGYGYYWITGNSSQLQVVQNPVSNTENRTSQPGHAPEDVTVHVNGTPITLKGIPSGTFTMGSSYGSSNEKPAHRVSVPAFRVMTTEVTWDMYQPCIDAGVCPNNDSDAGWGKGNRPVINVSLNNITQHYIPWLNQQTGQQFRLPTEAEWEYAGRAGSTTKYSWGNDIGRNNANCDGCGSQWDNKQTAPVASFKPNAFGLYDMHGNVWEWTQDFWHSNYDGAPFNGEAWGASGGGDYRRTVLRGGSWDNLTGDLRVVKRLWGRNGAQNNRYGFRLAQDTL